MGVICLMLSFEVFVAREKLKVDSNKIYKKLNEILVRY